MLLSRKGGGAGASGAAEILGNLRGLAAKVGQMASYIDGVVPEEHREAYETAMKGLRAAAPTSSIKEIRRTVEEDLGAPIDQLFSEWNDVPIASASIGQVHRARMPDGRDVAVKVQHIGITKAIESDLKNAGMFEQMAAIGGARRFQTKEVLEVVRARFREELDYEHEAMQQKWFANLHRADDQIHVPAVVEERSSKRVLCSEFVKGMGFDDAIAAPLADREAWARTLWRFVFKGNLVGGRFNADPHPGNYVFHDNGRVTFLDYGCVQLIAADHQKAARDMHRHAIEGNEKAFFTAARELFHSKPGRHEDLMFEFTRACFEPLFTHPFQFTKDYAAGLVNDIKRISVATAKLKPAELNEMPADMFFINRLEFGLYSVLARLDVSVDYAAVEKGFWHEIA